MDADIDDVFAKTSTALKKEDEAIDNALHTSIRNGLVASQQHADGLEDLAAKSLGLFVETSSTHSNVSQKSVTQHHTSEVDRAASKRTSSSDTSPERETNATNAYHDDILKTPHADGGEDASPVSNCANTSGDGGNGGEASSISTRANNLGEDKEMPEPHSEMGQTSASASASEPQSPWSPWTDKSPTDMMGDVSIPPIELAALGKNGASMRNIPEEFEFTSPADASSSGKDLMLPLTGQSQYKPTHSERSGRKSSSSSRSTTHEGLLLQKQSEACRKLQSLWKGHKTRIFLKRTKASLHVLELRMKVREWDMARMEEFLYCKMSIWNLKTSEIIFSYETGVRSIDSSFRIGRSLLIPGMDNDCIMSVSLFDPRPGGVLFEVKLVDLAHFRHSAAGLQTKEFRVICNKKGLANHITSEKETSVVLCVQTRSSPHTHAGWLWASRVGEESSSARSPRFSPLLVSPRTARSMAKIARIGRFERLWSFFHKWLSWVNPSGNQVQPGTAILQSSDNGPSTLANPRPEVSAAELDVSEDNRANAWECYWSILINGKLYLYESYGDLKPLYVIRAAQCKTFSAAFSGTFDSPEFAIEATNATAQGMVIEPVGKRRRLHNHLRGASRVWFVTTSRAQTVTWVSKLRAAAHAQNPSPRIEVGNDETGG